MVPASLWRIGESDARLRGEPGFGGWGQSYKQLVQASRTSLPSGLQATVFTGKDKASEHSALCTAANHKITEWSELEGP